FGWIEPDDAQANVFSFLRYDSDGAPLACLANFSGVPHERYKVGLPKPGRWIEVLNTDAREYGGAGGGNLGGVDAVAEPWHNQPASATVHLPALSVIWFKPA